MGVCNLKKCWVLFSNPQTSPGYRPDITDSNIFVVHIKYAKTRVFPDTKVHIRYFSVVTEGKKCYYAKHIPIDCSNIMV